MDGAPLPPLTLINGGFRNPKRPFSKCLFSLRFEGWKRPIAVISHELTNEKSPTGFPPGCLIGLLSVIP
jgi:hypothetical protein